MKRKTAIVKISRALPTRKGAQGLLTEVRELIVSTRQNVARGVNAELVRLYWKIGQRISQHILQAKRAKYGQEIIATLSQQLTREFGRGFTAGNLSRMMALAEAFEEEILAALSQELGWSHFVELLPLNKPMQRDFYGEMCRIERWSVRTLRKKIQGMLYERTVLSKKPAKLAVMELKQLRNEDKLTPDLVFRDPYLLDFLGLKDTYAEKDLEAAILREMEAFILELGVGFAFLERQKRITIDGRDFHLDLLFYHRHLRRLVAIELKLGEFEAADKGQMELYLKWLERYEQKEDEDKPIGLILCANKSRETIELLDLERSNIRVSSYWTNAVPKEELERKLHEAVRLARAGLASRRLPDQAGRNNP